MTCPAAPFAFSCSNTDRHTLSVRILVYGVLLSLYEYKYALSAFDGTVTTVFVDARRLDSTKRFAPAS